MLFLIRFPCIYLLMLLLIAIYKEIVKICQVVFLMMWIRLMLIGFVLCACQKPYSIWCTFSCSLMRRPLYNGWIQRLSQFSLSCSLKPSEINYVVHIPSSTRVIKILNAYQQYLMEDNRVFSKCFANLVNFCRWSFENYQTIKCLGHLRYLLCVGL